MENHLEIIEENFSTIAQELIEIQTQILNDDKSYESVTKHEYARFRLFYEWSEILYVYDNIKNCKIYLNSFKYYPKISKANHIKFIFSAYLNEIYTLRLRFHSYCKTIKKVLKKYQKENSNDKKLKYLLEELESTNKIIDKSLKKIIHTRGSSVHEKYYTDNHINKSFGYETIVDLLNMEEFDSLFKEQIAETKRHYVKVLKENEKALDILIDMYSEKVNYILFINKYIEEASFNPWQNNHIDGRTKI